MQLFLIFGHHRLCWSIIVNCNKFLLKTDCLSTELYKNVLRITNEISITPIIWNEYIIIWCWNVPTKTHINVLTWFNKDHFNLTLPICYGNFVIYLLYIFGAIAFPFSQLLFVTEPRVGHASQIMQKSLYNIHRRQHNFH